MKTKIPEKTVRQMVKKVYQQRAERLKTLKLNDIVMTTPRVFWTSRSESAPDIVARLIEYHLASFEDEWQQALQGADFCLYAIRLDQEVDERSDYQEQLDYALNRLSLAFINTFCKSDYSIDWSKLLHFNSGKN